MWTPVLAGEARERALALIRAELAATRSPSPETSPCISGGSAGYALLHGYWFLEYGDEPSADATFELAEHAIEHGGGLPLQLYAGVVGVGWSIHHLTGRVLPDGDDPLASLDDALLELVRERPWTRTWDLLQGLVGIGHFALSRSGPDGACVAAVLALLEELAEDAGDGVAWRTRPEHIGDDVARRYPSGTLIVGAAHGVPAVIWFLTQCMRGESLRSRAAPLLARAVDWLLARELEGGRHNRFPGYVDADRRRGDREASAPWFRPSWCYADAGLVLPLLAAARVLGSAEAKDRALAIARRVGACRHDESWELDPSLCHGAAGLALICRRLVDATGDEAFAESARYWAARAMALMDPPMEGLTQGFLMGATGAALALLALSGNVPPAWDALLLLSDVEVPASGAPCEVPASGEQ